MNDTSISHFIEHMYRGGSSMEAFNEPFTIAGGDCAEGGESFAEGGEDCAEGGNDDLFVDGGEDCAEGGDDLFVAEGGEDCAEGGNDLFVAEGGEDCAEGGNDLFVAEGGEDCDEGGNDLFVAEGGEDCDENTKVAGVSITINEAPQQYVAPQPMQMQMQMPMPMQMQMPMPMAQNSYYQNRGTGEDDVEDPEYDMGEEEEPPEEDVEEDEAMDIEGRGVGGGLFSVYEGGSLIEPFICEYSGGAIEESLFTTFPDTCSSNASDMGAKIKKGARKSYELDDTIGTDEQCGKTGAGSTSGGITADEVSSFIGAYM